MIILFWATWCKPCIQELKTMHEIYEEWQEKTGVKIIAISIDDSRSSKKVAPFVNGRGWNFDVYIDENSDFRRAMNVNNPPHSFLVDGKGKIVYQHNGYAPGDEDKLFKELNKIVK
jgi:peroxiredoxin